jgi:hypothetical protein
VHFGNDRRCGFDPPAHGLENLFEVGGGKLHVGLLDVRVEKLVDQRADGVGSGKGCELVAELEVVEDVLNVGREAVEIVLEIGEELSHSQKNWAGESIAISIRTIMTHLTSFQTVTKPMIDLATYRC